MQKIGDYEILSEIDRGGMGVVYHARGADGAKVALKLLLDRKGSEVVLRKRFQREIQALVRLRHPNVAKILDAGEHDGAPYMVMRLYEGPTLQAKIEAEGPLDPEWTSWVVSKLASALEHAHEHGVVHRDLKPSNVLLLQDGIQPVLIDFGLTKVTDEGESRTQLTTAGHMQGTPGYWAPEQIEGDPTRLGPRIDVYGLGAILYACLTGRPPCEGRSVVQIVRATLSEPPPAPSQLRPELDPGLDTITLCCLEKDPARRYSSISEVREDLRLLGRGEPLKAQLIDDARRDLQKGWDRRNRNLLIRRAVAVLLLVVVAGAVVFQVNRRAEERELAAKRVLAEKVRRAETAQRAETVRRAVELEKAAELRRVELRELRERAKRERAAEWERELKRREVEKDKAAVAFDKAETRRKNDEAVYAALLAKQEVERRSEPRASTVADYTAAILQDPGDPKNYYNRGRARQHESQDFRGAISDYGKALELDPSAVAVYRSRGKARRILLDFHGAIEDFTKAIDLEPNDPATYRSRGDAKARLRRNRSAALDFEQALRLDPDGLGAAGSRKFIRTHLGREPKAGK